MIISKSCYIECLWILSLWVIYICCFIIFACGNRLSALCLVCASWVSVVFPGPSPLPLALFCAAEGKSRESSLLRYVCFLCGSGHSCRGLWHMLFIVVCLCIMLQFWPLLRVLLTVLLSFNFLARTCPQCVSVQCISFEHCFYFQVIGVHGERWKGD